MNFKFLKEFELYILSFFVTLFVVVSIVSGTLLTTIYNNNYFINLLPKDYYENVYSDVAINAFRTENNEIIEITQTGKISRRTSLLVKSMNWQNLVNDVDGYIKTKLENPDADYKINREKVKSRFLNALTSYMASKKLKISDEQMQVFEGVAESCTKVYEERITFPKLEEYLKIANEYKKLVSNTFKISLAISVILILVKLLIKVTFVRKFRFSIYEALSIGLTLVAVPLYLFGSNYFSNFTFSSVEIVSNFWTSYINGIFGYLILYGIVIATIAFILLIFVFPKSYEKELISIRKEALKSKLNQTK